MKCWIASLCFCCIVIVGQTQTITQDSLVIKKYAFKVGNLGFAADSLELIIPDLPQGANSTYDLEVFNFGSQTIKIEDGHSSRFVKIKANPPLLPPESSGVLHVELEVVNDIPLGPYRAEVALDTDDLLAKYKFLYLLSNIVPNSANQAASFDSIPRLIFETYNYDFGHLYRGKKLYHSFLYSNKGGFPVVISGIEITPGCEIVGVPPQIVDSGESGMIRVKIATRGCVGVQHRSVILHTNDPITPVIILGIHGSVKSTGPSTKNPKFCKEGPGYF